MMMIMMMTMVMNCSCSLLLLQRPWRTAVSASWCGVCRVTSPMVGPWTRTLPTWGHWYRWVGRSSHFSPFCCMFFCVVTEINLSLHDELCTLLYWWRHGWGLSVVCLHQNRKMQHVCIYTCLHTHTHIHTHTHTHSDTNTHTHTHTHIGRERKWKKDSWHI